MNDEFEKYICLSVYTYTDCFLSFDKSPAKIQQMRSELGEFLLLVLISDTQRT